MLLYIHKRTNYNFTKSFFMKNVLIVSLLTLCFFSGVAWRPGAADVIPTPAGPNQVKIQVALLLDTSNSMDGLIDQAKSQLWKMVNKLADAGKQQKEVLLEIALYEYGNAELASREGYIRQVQPMKSDLDGLSQQLFALRTNGGDEYCGWAIQSALDQLPWSESSEDLHLIIIAGNEPFDQGRVDYKISCANAAKKDIIVNTIFCGDYQEGKRTFWFDCTELTKGKFMNIDTDQKVIHIPTPYDTTLMRLNQELNETYIGFGHKGAEMKGRQAEQDANAISYGAANMTQRALAKSKKSYVNDDWDLVDAYKADSTFVQKVKKEELPEAYKNKSEQELKQAIRQLGERRSALRTEMADLQIKIDEFIAQTRKQLGDTQTLDNVLISTLVEQAGLRGFEWKN